jgi:HSP20 family protein
MANHPVPHGQHGKLARPRSQHPLDLFRTQMDDLFDRFFGGFMTPFNEDRNMMRMWDFNVTDNDKDIVVRAEMPGFDEKEVQVQLHDDLLTIKAEKEQRSEGQEDYRSFYRTVTLPSGIDAEHVQATYHNGVLELHIPRPQGSQPRRIQVQGKPSSLGPQTQQTSTAQGQQAATTQTQPGNTAGKSQTENKASGAGQQTAQTARK